MNKTGIIFDMDGILFDTEHLWQELWHEIAEERGVTLPEDWVYRVSGTSGELQSRIVAECYHVENGDAIVADCKSRMYKKLQTSVPVKRGVPEVLEEMRRQGKKIAVASSSDLGQIESNLRVAGLLSYFDAVVSGQEVEHAKPAPDIFLLAAKKLGCAPEDCVVFEDSFNGVRAGKRAGMFVCMVPDLIAPTPEIEILCGSVRKDFFEVLDDIRE